MAIFDVEGLQSHTHTPGGPDLSQGPIAVEVDQPRALRQGAQICHGAPEAVEDLQPGAHCQGAHIPDLDMRERDVQPLSNPEGL